MFGSLEKHHPEIKKIIFLVDLPDDSIDYKSFFPVEIVVVDKTIVPGFTGMLERYDVMELNTAIRPFIIRYLIDNYPGTGKIYYLDPDMYIYDKLDAVEKLLETEDIIITPHFLQPVPIDGRNPFENLALNYGTYNLGFLAINPATENTKRFLSWWGERTSRFAYNDPANGYFTDQIWHNLVPIFFEKVHTLKHPGYNMAAWNLHERSVKSYNEEGRIVLNSGDPLIIYHFSSWNFEYPREISRIYNRFSIENRPDLEKLYNDYYQDIAENKMEQYNKIPCALPFKKAEMVKRSRMQQLLLPGVNLLKKIWRKI